MLTNNNIVISKSILKDKMLAFLAFNMSSLQYVAYCVVYENYCVIRETSRSASVAMEHMIPDLLISEEVC